MAIELLTLVTTDSDTSSGFSYTIASVTGASMGNFSINALTGALSITSSFDFEVISGLIAVEINVNDGANDYSETVEISVTDVNEIPTSVSLSSRISNLPLSVDTSNRIRLANIDIADDALGDETITFTGADASLFEVFDGNLYLKADAVLSAGTVDVTVSVQDNSLGGPPVTVDFNLEILASDTVLMFEGTSGVTEGSNVAVTGTYTLTDGDDTGDSLLTINGITAEDGIFAGDYGTLTLLGTSYSYVLNSNNVAVLGLSSSSTLTESFRFVSAEGVASDLEITITGVNTPPTDLTFSLSDAISLEDAGDDTGASLSVFENMAIELLTLETIDPDTSSGFTYSIVSVVGTDEENFSINSLTGALSTTGLDFELIDADIRVTIQVSDGNNTYNEDVAINVIDVNEAPTEIILSPSIRFLLDLSDTTERIKVSDIAIIDDALGEETITLSGADALSFEEEDRILYLNAGVSLIHGDVFNVIINVEDPSLGGGITADFELEIINNPATIILEENRVSNIELDVEEVNVLEVLEGVISEPAIELEEEDNEVLEILANVFNISSPANREELVRTIIPTTHTTFAPAVENLVTSVVRGLTTRSFSKVDTGFVNLNGPEGRESTSLPGRSFWYDLSHNTGSRDGETIGSGYDYSGSSIRIGYERLYEEFFVGSSIGYGSTRVDNTNASGSADITNVSIGIYGNYQKEADFVSGTFVISFSEVDATRSRQVLGDLDGDTSVLSIDLDLVYGISSESNNNNSILTYLVGARYNSTNLDDVSENGGGLGASSTFDSFTSFYFNLGAILSFDLSKNFDKSNLFSLYIDYNNNLLDTERGATSQFTSGGDQFEVSGVDEGSNSFALGMIYKYEKSNTTYEFGYNYRFTSITSSSNISLKIKHKF